MTGRISSRGGQGASLHAARLEKIDGSVAISLPK
jgi:hypothetical protein